MGLLRTLALATAILFGSTFAAVVLAQETGPRGGRRGPGPAASEGIRLFVPSAVGGESGIATVLTLPKRARHAEGAPVVIHVPGGWGSSGLDQRGASMAEFGFVELRFAFPGAGTPEFRSGGELDNRGAGSIRSLADVVLFAMGKKKDANGKGIQDHAGGVKIAIDDVGLAGWSNGGNPCGLAMALHGTEFPELAFYVSFESPLGEGAAGAELGGFGTGPNPAYDPDTGVLDLGGLAYDPELPLPGKGAGAGGRRGAGGAGAGANRGGAREGRGAPANAPLRGTLFFDVNANAAWDDGVDFAAAPVLMAADPADPRAGMRAWYSLRVLREAERRGFLGEARPAHIPTLPEAETFWRMHDAAPLLPDAVKHCPKTAVIVYASEEDHVQRALDHPHILAQVEGYRAAGARFLRLNPDRAYVEWVNGRSEPDAADNVAGTAYDHKTIRTALEPEHVASDPGYMAAALCEVADRVRAGKWEPNLDRVLFADAPRGWVPPARR